MRHYAFLTTSAALLALTACSNPPPPPPLSPPGNFDALTRSANDYRTAVEAKAGDTRTGRYISSMTADAALLATGVGVAYKAGTGVLGTLGTVAVASGGVSAYVFPTSYDPIYQAAIVGADCVATKGRDVAIKVRAVDSTLAYLGELLETHPDEDTKVAKARKEANEAKDDALEAANHLHAQLVDVHRQTIDGLDKAKPTTEQLLQFVFTNFVTPDRATTTVAGKPAAAAKAAADDPVGEAVAELKSRVEVMRQATAAAMKATCKVTPEGAPLTINPAGGLTLHAGETQVVSVTGGKPPYVCELGPMPEPRDFTLTPVANKAEWKVGVERDAKGKLGAVQCSDKSTSATLFIRVAD